MMPTILVGTVAGVFAIVNGVLDKDDDGDDTTTTTTTTDVVEWVQCEDTNTNVEWVQCDKCEKWRKLPSENNSIIVYVCCCSCELL